MKYDIFIFLLSLVALTITKLQLSLKGLMERKKGNRVGPQGKRTYLLCDHSGYWFREELLQELRMVEPYFFLVEAMLEGVGLEFCRPSSKVWDQTSSGRPSLPGHSPAGVCDLLSFSLLHHPPPVAQARSWHLLAQCAADQLQEKGEQLRV